jgi:polar amino acid transport system permease protein
MIWDWNYALEIFPQMAAASLVTLQATIFGFAFAAVLGLVWAIVNLLEIPIVTFVVRLWVEFIRTTPVLIQLFVMYYFLPLAGIFIPAMLCGVLTLGMHYSAYCSEVYRSGFEQVDRGQWEAAKAINLSTYQTLKRVILPQAIPPIILPLGNYLVTMFKETPVLLAITVIELVATARIIGNDTFRYTEPITLAGFFFLMLSLIAAKSIRIVNRKMALPGLQKF